MDEIAHIQLYFGLPKVLVRHQRSSIHCHSLFTITHTHLITLLMIKREEKVLFSRGNVMSFSFSVRWANVELFL